MEVILNGKTKLQVKDLFKKQNRTTMNSFDDFNDDEERRQSVGLCQLKKDY